MNHAIRKRRLTRLGMPFGILLLLFAFAGEAQAQWAVKWLSVGELHHPYVETTMAAEAMLGIDAVDQSMWYPGLLPMQSNARGEGLWISAENVLDQDGNNWPVRVSHMGPRVTGIGEFFRDEHILVSQFEAPRVEIDGLESFFRPVVIDEVDPDLPTDRAIMTRFHTSVGISGELTAYAMSNEYHDKYHIYDYTFTNTGIMSDEDPPPVEQLLEEVYITFLIRNAPSQRVGGWQGVGDGAAWGQYTMNDAVGDGFEDYHDNYGTDFRGAFSWIGHNPGRSDYNALGAPLWTDDGWLNPVRRDTVGRLAAAYHLGKAVLFAPSEPGGTTDDPGQPRVMTYMNSDNEEITGSSNHNDLALMQLERQFITTGIEPGTARNGPRTTPYHGHFVEPSGDFTQQSTDPGMNISGGIQNIFGYGPYDLAHGESVRIVFVRGVGSLGVEPSTYIGQQYKRSGANDDLLIEHLGADGEIHAMTKNEWVISSRDSLFQTWERARAVFEHVIEGGGTIPQPPRPPSLFSVSSGADQISLEWETYAGEPDPPGGWEIYRARERYDGLAVPDETRAYELIAAPGPSDRNFVDPDPERGQDYFYYIQAVGDPISGDPLDIIPDGAILRSSRHYTQAFEPATLVRPPADALADVRVVPNPYNLAADEDLRFDREHRLGFLDMPGNATIRIFTQLGELVDTIEHTAGSGDVYWDLTTSSRQVVVSGIYIAHITDNDTGDSLVRKFVIIR